MYPRIRRVIDASNMDGTTASKFPSELRQAGSGYITFVKKARSVPEKI